MGGKSPSLGPIGYVGHQALATYLANSNCASTVMRKKGFITAVAPGSFARRKNHYYKSIESSSARSPGAAGEYRAIVDADF